MMNLHTNRCTLNATFTSSYINAQKTEFFFYFRNRLRISEMNSNIMVLIFSSFKLCFRHSIYHRSRLKRFLLE